MVHTATCEKGLNHSTAFTDVFTANNLPNPLNLALQNIKLFKKEKKVKKKPDSWEKRPFFIANPCFTDEETEA